jgi:hypothetical protein
MASAEAVRADVMATKYILARLAVLFVVLALARGGLSRPQARTWLLIAGIFGVVSAWLFYAT